jgi:hypothetical protein
MRHRIFVGILVALLLTGGPTGQLTAQTPVVSELTGAALLDDWGNRFKELGTLVSENALRTHIRIAIVQLAMFDAVNAVLEGRYRPFALKSAAVPGASAEAAVIRAAYIVARHEFQTVQAIEMIEAAYNTSIAAVAVSALPDAIEGGILVGEAAANDVLAARVGDNRDYPELEGYSPGSGPGVWSPTPPAFGDPQTPFLRFVTPFGYDDPARFRPHAPPALDSKTYTDDYNESKDVGRDSETTRTVEQSETALFWSPSASTLWIANIRSLASGMDLLTAARFEALGIAAVNNALIACWDAKYTYMFWRPVTAIRAGDSDGNSETEPDGLWTPFIGTPSHPEYPAAHTTVGAAALGFYTVWAGTDQFPLAFAGNRGAVRHYASVNEIHAEEGNARVWGGMHWRNSTEVGTVLGRKVGKYTARHLLKPLDD